ncbi:MAG: lipopolysaccharide biosynthesis protein [Chloroflexota bacterium]
MYESTVLQSASSLLSMVFGICFWTIAAWGLSPADVGVGAGLVPLVTLIANGANPGLGIAMMRFLPRVQEASQERLLALSAVARVAILAVPVSLVAATVAQAWTPELFYSRRSISVLAFVAGAGIMWAVSTAQEQMIVGLRRPRLLVLKVAVFGVVRLGLLWLAVAFLFPGEKGFGVLFAWCGGALLACLAVQCRIGFTMPTLALWPGMASYGLKNWLPQVAGIAPQFLFPLIVVSAFGVSANSQFYAAWMAATVLFVVAASAANALLAEGSRPTADRRGSIVRALIFTEIVVVPASVALAIGGDLALAVLGPTYKEAGPLLRILAVSGPLYGFNAIFLATNQLRHNLMVVNAAHLTVTTLAVFAVQLAQDLGITALGIGWLAGQSLVATWFLAWLIASGVLKQAREHVCTAILGRSNALPFQSEPPSKSASNDEPYSSSVNSHTRPGIDHS